MTHTDRKTAAELEALPMGVYVEVDVERLTEGHRHLMIPYTACTTRHHELRGYECQGGKYRLIARFKGYGRGTLAARWLYEG